MTKRTEASWHRRRTSALLGLVLVAAAVTHCSPEERDFSAFLGDGDGDIGDGDLGGDQGDGDIGDGDEAGGAAGDGDGDLGAMCGSSGDCLSTAPICEDDSCRTCSGHSECEETSSYGWGPFCVEGACVNCVDSDDCADPNAPVCGDDNSCRGCQAHDECASMACNLEVGTCVAEENIVYVLPGTGLGGTCGTITTPCLNFNGAYPNVTETRNTVVIQKTASAVDGSAVALPPGIDELTIIGNDVLVAPYTGDPAFALTGGRRLILDGVSVGTSVTCDDSEIEVYRSSLSHAEGTALSATNCNVTVLESRFEGSSVGISASCNPSDCSSGSYSHRIERTWFADNDSAAFLSGDSITVQNDIFVNNGVEEYQQVVSIQPEVEGTFSFNTMWGNFNNCIYIGLFNFSAPTVARNNIDWNSFPMDVEGDPICDEQVYEYDAPTYTISEVTYPGAGNQVADPLFVDPDADDFHLQMDSPAIDAGEDVDVPEVDFFGNPRVVGDGPDCGAIEFQ